MSKQRVNFSSFSFAPVIDLPADYEVFDFTKGYDPFRTLRSPFGIGRYNEKRVGVYTTPLFGGVRNIHMGIDIGAPVGTAIHAFYDGEVACFGYNGAAGDYGYTLITKHRLGESYLWALYGHLSARSLEDKHIGRALGAGDVIAWIGDRNENGGWNPHLHFQLSYEEPLGPDLPGVVSEADRERALETYPDPRLVLGMLYPDS